MGALNLWIFINNESLATAIKVDDNQLIELCFYRVFKVFHFYGH